MLPLKPTALFLPLLVLGVTDPSAGFFGWLTQSATPAAPAASFPTAAPNPGSLPHVPFEMTTADEQFLTERLHLSPLDSCHHKVIARLQASCADLTEEALAKLSVSLFNCQAQVEGRRTYLCTEDTTLAECTADMDPDTWNAYHIVSNRARAVCYAVRQTQFKLQAEHTVNALVSTAVSQLEAMRALKSGQEELKALTSESLQKVVSSQQELLAQQEEFRGSQGLMEESIHSNLDQLAQEKALIASGQQQVVQLIEGITQRMEEVSSHLDDQDAELQEGRRAILKDLTQAQDRAQDVYSKIETNLGSFLAYQNQTALYYDELMGKLQKMNDSLGLVLRNMERMQSNVEGRLRHIQRFISWAGFSLSSIYTCVLHGSYFLLAALIMTFLQTPGLPRAVLLILVTSNALLELNHAASLGFQSLTSLLLLAVAGKEGNAGLVKEELEELSYLSGEQDAGKVGRESPEEEEEEKATFLPSLAREGTALFSTGWQPPQGQGSHATLLHRLRLARSARHEASERLVDAAHLPFQEAEGEKHGGWRHL
ncbi:Protein brambleberry [Varanus komodoensis]|nr:Protein brambleberry [Varanus komodoensis]